MGGLKSSSMNSNGDNMWKFYSEDSPGVKVNSNLSGSIGHERTEFHFVRTALNVYGFSKLNFQIGPVPVLVLSLMFIGSVFIMHIWGKYNRVSVSSAPNSATSSGSMDE